MRAPWIARTRMVLPASLAFALALVPAPLLATEQEPPQAPETPAAIPVADIPSRGNETLALVRSIEQGLTTGAEFAGLPERLDEAAQQISSDQAELQAQIDRGTTLQDLYDTRQTWLRHRTQLNDWQRRLEGRWRALQNDYEQLTQLAQLWGDTRTSAREQEPSPALLDRIGTVIQRLQATGRELRRRLDEVIELQGRVADLQSRVTDSSAQLDNLENQARARALRRDSPPFWRILDTGDERLRSDSTTTWERQSATAQAFFRTHTEGLAWQLGLFVGTMIAMMIAARWLEGIRAGEDVLRGPRHILSRPLSAAALITLWQTARIHGAPPLVVSDIVVLASIVPVLRLVSALLAPAVRGPAYALAFLYALAQVLQLTMDGTLLRRLTVLLVAALAGIVLQLLARNKNARAAAETSVWWSAALAGVQVGALLLGIAAGANLLGWVKLSELITTATLSSAYFAIVLAATAMVVSGLLAVIPRTIIGTLFRSIGRHSEGFISRTTMLVQVIATFSWAWITLQLFGLDQLVQGQATRLWWTPLPGEFTITIGDILSAMGVLLLTGLVSRAARFLLKQDVLSRLDLEIGQTSAILTIVHYVILTAGVIWAATEAGFSGTQLTVVAGALGVGIGFGLQNTVNNFFSGLILIFERPISVGERIQVGQLSGIVQRIGIRSSIIRTYEGADVIVPNGELITREVVNWTLTDRKRRAQVVVGVEYGSDPERIIEILEAVAQNNEQVLNLPKPEAVFTGFGDSSLDFRLMFWVPASDFLQLSSCVAIGVNRALADAGIVIPFPQRDLHIRSGSDEAPRSPAEPPTGTGE